MTRKTDKGLPRYFDADESDVFVLSGAEDLVPARIEDGSGSRVDVVVRNDYEIQRYRPRVEGLFARIERWTHVATGDRHWRATTRDNVTNVYGRSTTARIADPDAPHRVFSWLLEETRDDRGNIARYVYKAEDGAGVDPGRASEDSRFESAGDGTRLFRANAQRYLKRVFYGNQRPGDASDWLFEVVFDFGEHDETAPTAEEQMPWLLRADAFSSYRASFEVRTYRRCRRALMFHRFAELGENACLVRSTDLTYDDGPVVSYLTAVTQVGYLRDPITGSYQRATLPPLDLDYERPHVHDELKVIDEKDLDGIPGWVGGADSLWIDLDGEGIPGVLTLAQRAWQYKSNLGDGRLAAPRTLRSLPAPADLGGGLQQLSDLGGDGQLDLVQYGPALSGFFTRTSEGDWMPFAAFAALPNIDWASPNLRLLDLDGDGHADVLVTEDDVFVWYRSRAKAGFDPAVVLPRPRDEKRGPAIVFADGTESIHLVDMSGDGLIDLVRVREREICYWPNLGHGSFGRKITMDRSPRLGGCDQFDPGRIRFADIDGSGTADLVYLGHGRVELYFNEAGNGFSEATSLRSSPTVDSLAHVSLVDLLGRGTACLVWSSPLPGEHRPIAYVDLMGGTKPHLLRRIVNNLGAETRIAYDTSTRFYLRDKAEGRSWCTRLTFPVHLVERIEQYDHVAGTRLVRRFRYHHGYFDGHEREFRGFASVEQWDSESLNADSVDEAFELPPVCTRTWFHTGAWLERERLELALAAEYYGHDPLAPLLPDTLLPPGLSVREEREATRALRGRILRQEIYAEDGTVEAVHPYSASERSYDVRLLQHATDIANAVFLVLPRESIGLHYERRPNDPRLQQELVLEADAFGNVTRAATLAYPRRAPEMPEQERLWVSVHDSSFVNRPDEVDWYRIGVPTDTATSELTGLSAPPQGVLSAQAVRAALSAAAEIPYEAQPSGTALERRVVKRARSFYYRDDLTGPLPHGQIESHALPYETRRQAFTPGFLQDTYGDRVDDTTLQDAAYVLEDGRWWALSGHVIVDPARFYLAVEAVDAFGQHSYVRYDGYELLVIDSEDALHNRITAGARDALGNVTENGNDYRLLAPRLLTDPNLDRIEVELDILGMVVKTALLGKEGAGEGDTLADPTTRIEYDLHRWRDSNGAQPTFVHLLRRERHGSGNPRWQESYSYSDGSGREVMKKVQAEPGLAPVLDADGHLVRNPDGSPHLRYEENRWIGTGRTIFDNKGNPIKKYEPFFSGTHEYERESDLVEWGVTPILRYDPMGRLVRTDQPDGTHTLVVFDAWRHETWDANDTVEGTPWLARLQTGTAAEQRCAALALEHARTPTIAHLDSIGRSFLTIADNGVAGTYQTHIELDVEGNPCAIRDARGVTTLTQVFDMLGRKARATSADAGESRALADVAGRPILVWTARGHRLRHLYDSLRRPSHLLVREGDGPEMLVQRIVYGEAHADAVARNLRLRVYRTYDGAGVATNVRFDFKGNPLENTRRLAVAFDEVVDWSALGGLSAPGDIEVAAEPFLDEEVFATTATYDALDRIQSRTTPDSSETTPTYSEANLLDRLEVGVRGAASTEFISDIDYNARGQRERVEYATGIALEYVYDPATFRLTGQRATRSSDGHVLQDLTYQHDPVGNVVQIDDAVSFGNPEVAATGLYRYDPMYQLVEAEGREHPGQQPADEDPALLRLDHPNDLQALRRYRERFGYDAIGNVTEVTHLPLEPGVAGWTRTYEYAPDSNRLARTSMPGDPPGTRSAIYDHDAHGNMTGMPHLAELRWDHADRLQRCDRGGGGIVYFAYDAGGQRVRKLYQHGALLEERIYLGGLEIYRRRSAGTGEVALERETLHVMDADRRVALVETKIRDTSIPEFTPITRQRFQLENHHGSSVMELDETGGVIAYEEYFPYGGTAFRVGANGTPIDRRYRYCGKERDEETGLYALGQRYYAAWLGRWVSPDPAGEVDGTNLYRYCRNNPQRYVDPGGTDPDDALNVGPFQLSHFRVAPQGSLHLNVSLSGLFGNDPLAVSINSADLQGRIDASSDVQVPTLGLSGHGSYRLDLDRIQIENGRFRGDVAGRLEMNVSPFRLRMDLSASGQTQIANPFYPGQWREHLESAGNAARGEFTLLGRLSLMRWDVGHFRLEGSTSGGMTGPLSFRARVQPDFAPFASLRLSGQGQFGPGRFDLSGSFTGSVPPVAFAWGRWSFDLSQGFRAQGHYLGLLIPGLNGLSASINPTRPPDAETTHPHVVEVGHAPSSQGGAVYVHSPGVGAGYTYFDVGRERRFSLSVGMSFSSSLVPYYAEGISQPFNGPSAGMYFGAMARGTF